MSRVRIDGRRGLRRLLAWRRRAMLMTGAAGGAQSALGVEQEHARGDNPFALGEAGAHFDAVGKLRAEDNDRSHWRISVQSPF